MWGWGVSPTVTKGSVRNPRLLLLLLLLLNHFSVSDSVRPRRQQPTRLPRPWDSPGKNTGVGCHCLLRRDPRQNVTINPAQGLALKALPVHRGRQVTSNMNSSQDEVQSPGYESSNLFSIWGKGVKKSLVK